MEAIILTFMGLSIFGAVALLVIINIIDLIADGGI